MRLPSLFAISAALVFSSGCVHIKKRMADRLPTLDRFKEAGVIGENNLGYVEIRATQPDATAVTAEENTDRKTVYAAISRQAGASAESVGRARARQIAAGSAKGVWLQNEPGEWYRKP